MNILILFYEYFDSKIYLPLNKMCKEFTQKRLTLPLAKNFIENYTFSIDFYRIL